MSEDLGSLETVSSFVSKMEAVRNYDRDLKEQIAAIIIDLTKEARSKNQSMDVYCSACTFKIMNLFSFKYLDDLDETALAIREIKNFVEESQKKSFVDEQVCQNISEENNTLFNDFPKKSGKLTNLANFSSNCSENCSPPTDKSASMDKEVFAEPKQSRTFDADTSSTSTNSIPNNNRFTPVIHNLLGDSIADTSNKFTEIITVEDQVNKHTKPATNRIETEHKTNILEGLNARKGRVLELIKKFSTPENLEKRPSKVSSDELFTDSSFNNFYEKDFKEKQQLFNVNSTPVAPRTIEPPKTVMSTEFTQDAQIINIDSPVESDHSSSISEVNLPEKSVHLTRCELIYDAMGLGVKLEDWDLALVKQWFSNFLLLPPNMTNSLCQLVKNGQQLSKLTDHKLQRFARIKDPLHRQKIMVHLEYLRKFLSLSDTAEKRVMYCNQQMSHQWMVDTWLHHIGLPVYEKVFKERMIDALVLSKYSDNEIRKRLKVSNPFHIMSIKQGIALLEKINFDTVFFEKMRKLVSDGINGDSNYIDNLEFWSNSNIIKWFAGATQLTDIGVKLTNKGVHGGIFVKDLARDYMLLVSVLDLSEQEFIARFQLQRRVGVLLGLEGFTDRSQTNEDSMLEIYKKLNSSASTGENSPQINKLRKALSLKASSRR